jgi:hypothetical protein
VGGGGGYPIGCACGARAGGGRRKRGGGWRVGGESMRTRELVGSGREGTNKSVGGSTGAWAGAGEREEGGW